MERLLSATQAAEKLGVSFWTVYEMARTGKLPSVRIGRRRLFEEQALEELIRGTRSRQLVPPRDVTTDIGG